MYIIIILLRGYAHYNSMFQLIIYLYQISQSSFLTTIYFLLCFFFMGHMVYLRENHFKIHLIIYCCLCYFFYLKIGFYKLLFYIVFFAYDL